MENCANVAVLGASVSDALLRFFLNTKRYAENRDKQQLVEILRERLAVSEQEITRCQISLQSTNG